MRQWKIKIKTNKGRGVSIIRFWFTVHGLNGEITSVSEMYTRKHNANKTAQTYIDNGLNAVIVDET